ncbi:MAG: WG repeat-containing protein [Muribaculaceae bacterium]|nr:WG repeat-containing protein [Muribaculaceae bacterium]
MKKIVYILFIILSVTFFSCHNNSPEKEKDSNLLRIQIGDKFGFINENGKIIIEPQFDEANLTFVDDKCFVVIGERKGIINSTGEFIFELPDSVIYAYPYLEGFAKVKLKSGAYNIIDSLGSFIFNKAKYKIEIINDNGNIYFLGVAYPDSLMVNKESNWIVSDEAGVILYENEDSIGGFSENLCPIRVNNKWGYIDINGKVVIEPQYDYVRAFTTQKVARVKKDGLEFYIDDRGNTLFSCDKALTPLEFDRSIIEKNGKKFLVDSKGYSICSIDADEVYGFKETDSLATIIKDGKASKINLEGKIVLNTKYDDIEKFINGVAIVTKNEKFGVIDLKGNEIITPSFDVPGPLSANEYGLSSTIKNVICLVKVENNQGIFYYFDLNGNLIGKDMPNAVGYLPNNPQKEDFVKYFDAKLAELDPIEGLYYVTYKDYYQNRINPDIMGLNSSSSVFYAVLKDTDYSGYVVLYADGKNNWWVNKFVRIGETNDYAIIQNERFNQNREKYSSEGKVTIEDPSKFEFRLEKEHNSNYNFFVTYEFVKDYPPLSEYEKIQQIDWTGSGFAIADGYIATNYHVTSGAKNIRIRGVNGDFDKSYKAMVVASDKEHDLAIIRIVDKDFDGIKEIPYQIGKSSADVGENIFVLGYPQIDTMGEEIKLTEGVISALSGYKGNQSMFQISAAVQPGNSGGPLFNEEGNVIGVVCAKHADAENANYAVKVSYLFSLVNSSNLGIKLSDNKINENKVSSIVKKVKNFVYLIECSSK